MYFPVCQKPFGHRIKENQTVLFLCYSNSHFEKSDEVRAEHQGLMKSEHRSGKRKPLSCVLQDKGDKE